MPFVDVKTDWQIPIVQLAVNNGIIDTSTEIFRPDAPITRSEAVKILLKAGQITTTGSDAGFKDIGEQYEWALPYINEAAKLGIMIGQNKHFRPDAPISRAETAKIVEKARTIKNLENK